MNTRLPSARLHVLQLVLALLAAPAATANGTPETATASAPNLVLILADDLGYADVGFNGCSDIPTPNIDRIAREGVRFSNGYVTAAVCGPSRAGLITGRYQDRFGSSVNPTIDPSVLNGVPTTERTLAELLKPAGYATMAVGKWHLGTHPDLRPRERGFDEFFGFLSGGHDYMPEALTLEDLCDVQRKWDWYRTKLLHNGERVATDEYLTDELSHASVDFIDRVGAARPFFLYLAYNAPHTPMQATDRYLGRFSHIADEKRRTYAAMVGAMDDGIGRVLEALDRHGLTGNTLVVFLSDNGGARNNASRNTPLRGYKASPFEGGIRVPFAMRWPDRMPSGMEYHEPISSLDIAATVVAAAGPRAHGALLPGKPLDGMDLVPFVTGDRPGAPHDALYWWWQGREEIVVRRGSNKVIDRRGSKARRLFFHLGNDTQEQQPRDAATGLAVSMADEAWTLAEQMVPPAYPALGDWSPSPTGPPAAAGPDPRP